MAEPIDYLKTYLNIDPMDYSAMEAQIAGEPLPEREVFTMPSYRPQVDLSQMEAMPMQPMAPTQSSGDSRLQSLMDEIASLKAQIQAMQDTPEPMSSVDKATVMPSAPLKFLNPDGTPMTATTGQEAFYNDDGTRKTSQAPVGITNRMVGEPTKIFGQSRPTPKPISTTIAELQGQMQNIPQIPNAKSIGEAIRNLNLKFQPQMLPNQLPVQVRADSSTTPYNVIQDQPLPSLPSRDVARNVLDTQMMYRPMQFAGGGSLDKALQNLKSQLSNG